MVKIIDVRDNVAWLVYFGCGCHDSKFSTYRKHLKQFNEVYYISITYFTVRSCHKIIMCIINLEAKSEGNIIFKSTHGNEKLSKRCRPWVLSWSTSPFRWSENLSLPQNLNYNYSKNKTELNRSCTRCICIRSM